MKPLLKQSISHPKNLNRNLGGAEREMQPTCHANKADTAIKEVLMTKNGPINFVHNFFPNSP